MNIAPHTTQEQLFDVQNVVLTSNIQFKEIESAQFVDYVGLLYPGYLVLQRQSKMERVVCLFQASISRLQDSDRPPFTIQLTTATQSYILNFTQFKELRKWHDQLSSILEVLYKQAEAISQNFVSESKVQIQTKIPLPNQQLIKDLIPRLSTLQSAQNSKQRDDSVNQLLNELLNVESAKQNVTVISEIDTPVPLQNQINNCQFDVNIPLDSKNGLLNRFDVDVMLARFVFKIEQTELFVCKFNTQNINVFIFNKTICAETKGGKRSICKLDQIEFQYNKMIVMGQEINLTRTQIEYMKQLINEIITGQNTSLDQQQQIDATSSTAAAFPCVITFPTCYNKLICEIGGYVEILDPNLNFQNQFTQNLEIAPEMDLQSISDFIEEHLNTNNRAEAGFIQDQLGSINMLCTDLDTKNRSKNTKINVKNVYFVVIIQGWLLLYKNHSSLQPIRMFKLVDCIAWNGEQITKQKDVIHIVFSSGEDIFMKLLPKLSHNSNNFAKAIDEQKQFKEQHTIFDFIKAVHKCSCQQRDKLVLVNIAESDSVKMNMLSKQLYQHTQSNADDTQLLLALSCTMVDSSQTFKSYLSCIYILGKQFIIISQNGKQIKDQRFYFSEVQDIKDLKQTTIEIQVADQQIILKLKSSDKLQFLSTFVDLWQLSLSRQLTSMETLSPTPQALYEAEKKGYLYVHSDKGWQLKYCILQNNNFFIYENSLSLKPDQHFNSSCCIVSDAQGNIAQQCTCPFNTIQQKLLNQPGEYVHQGQLNQPYLNETADFSYQSTVNTVFAPCEQLEVSIVNTENFQHWARIHRGAVDSCAEAIKHKLRSKLQDRDLEDKLISDPERYYNKYTEIGNEFGLQYPGNIFKYQQQIKEIKDSVIPVGLDAEPNEWLTEEYLTDQEIFQKRSSFVLFNHKKVIWLAALSFSDQQSWLAAFEDQQIKIPQEISSAYSQLIKTASISQINQSINTAAQFKLRANDGITLFIPNKVLSTRFQIFNLQSKDSIIYVNVKNYKVLKQDQIKLTDYNGKSIIFDTLNIQNTLTIMDSIEINRQKDPISTYGVWDENTMPNIQIINAFLNNILPPSTNQEYYKPTNDKKLFDSKDLEQLRERIDNYLSQYISQQKIFSPFFDYKYKIETSLVRNQYSIGLNLQTLLNCIIKYQNQMTYNYNLLNVSNIALTRFNLQLNVLKINTEFLRNPKSLILKPIRIIIQQNHIFIFDQNKRDVIPLRECIARDSDYLLSQFIDNKEKIDETQQQQENVKNFYDFGEYKNETSVNQLSLDQKNQLKLYFKSKNNIQMFYNSVGLYYLKRQSYFFICTNSYQRQQFIDTVKSNTAIIPDYINEQLRQFTDEKADKQLLLSINTLFSEFEMENNEILIKRTQFQSFGSDQIAGVSITFTDTSHIDFQGDVFITSKNICLKLAQNQKGGCKIVKVAIQFKIIQRITLVQGGVAIIYLVKGQEARCQVNGIPDAAGFVQLVNDISSVTIGQSPRSILQRNPTGFAAQNCGMLLKQEAELWHKGKFQRIICVLNQLDQRITKSGKPFKTLLGIYENIGDYTALEQMHIQQIAVNINKEQFIADIIGQQKLERILIIFKVHHGKVQYLILRFDDQQSCEMFTQKIKNNVECSQQKLLIIKQFSSSGKRLAMQQEVYDTFSQRVKLPASQKFFMKVPATVASKILGIPGQTQTTFSGSDFQQQKIQKKLIQNQQQQQTISCEDYQNSSLFQTESNEIILQPPPITESNKNAGNLYLLSECLCYASETQIEVIPYSNISHLYLANTLFSLKNESIETTIKNFPEITKLPNSFIISATRPVGYSYNCDQIQEATVQEALPSDSEDEVEQFTELNTEPITFQFVILPHSADEIISDEELITGQLQQVNSNTQNILDKFKENIKVGQKQVQCVHTTLQVFQIVTDLCYQYHNKVPPSLFTSSPQLFALCDAMQLSLQMLTDDFGWSSVIGLVKFETLFIFDNKISKNTKFRQYQCPVKFIKAIDLRRAKIVDGKFLTGIDLTLSIAGNKFSELNSRLFIDATSQQQSEVFVGIGNSYSAQPLLYKKRSMDTFQRFIENKLALMGNCMTDDYKNFKLIQNTLSESFERAFMFTLVSQPTEQFKSEQNTVIQLSNNEVLTNFSQLVSKITLKYPITPQIKSQVDKLTQSQESQINEEWKQFNLSGEPLMSTRCSLLSQKVTVPGRILFGRVHLLFVGQVLGSKIYLVRRLGNFSQAPELNQNQLVLHGGNIGDEKLNYKHDPSLIPEAESAEQKILNQNIQLNQDHTLVFDNFPDSARTIFYDLISMAVGLAPPSQLLAQPSATACYPCTYSKQLLKHNGKQECWEAFNLIIFNNYVYIYENLMAEKPLAMFGFQQLQAERVFVDEQLYQVDYEDIQTSISKQTGRKLEELSDIDILNTENEPKVEQEKYIQQSTITKNGIFKNVLSIQNLRQCVKLTAISNKQADQLIDSQFVFDESDSEQSQDKELLQQLPAEFFISSDSTEQLEQLYNALIKAKQNYQQFVETINKKTMEHQLVQLESVTEIEKTHKIKQKTFYELHICKLMTKEAKKKNQKQIGVSLVFKQRFKKQQLVIGSKQILDCSLQKLFHKNTQYLTLTFRSDQGVEKIEFGITGTQKDGQDMAKAINMMMWWQPVE
ncbi:Conserved_hypothetical protein [Hexamita inflata]|uniref:PH domain-containing protein n=1 Tax=Hexamita inflata TaxID=28002 RepID=A0AA86NE54_9EUKA|nr:Conserved hypothetical protein [Hexamita inflata]